MREINIELLVGRAVISKTGKTIGHIEEMRAEEQGDDLVITEFHVGSYAAMERVSAYSIGARLLTLLGLRRQRGGYRIRWDQINFNSSGPQLVCDEEELAPLNEDG